MTEQPLSALDILHSQAGELIKKERFLEAEALLRPHLASGSGPLALWRLYAAAIRPQGRIAETLSIQKSLVESVPGNLPDRFDLSETLLLLGDFENGWREYRWRYSLAHTTSIERKPQVPRWHGQPIPGKTLLIFDEQGFGDTLQFIRMVAWAKERSGARVILEIHASLLPLAKRIKGFDEIITRGTLPPYFDFHCEMMSLPMVMGLKLTDLPGHVPYVAATPKHLTKWRKRLKALPRPLVALVWAGSPGHPNDATRTTTLASFAPLALPDVTYLAIQKGPKASEADQPPAGMNLIALDEEIEDFEDTAAILTLADLLISVDSSPVHLAGALNRPAWLLLPFVPDWRWLLEREDTPWYPSLKLWRQIAHKNWDELMTRVGQALVVWRDGRSS